MTHAHEDAMLYILRNVYEIITLFEEKVYNQIKFRGGKELTFRNK